MSSFYCKLQHSKSLNNKSVNDGKKPWSIMYITLIVSFLLFDYFQVGKAWLRDLPEDLDMFIAQRDFERAMELIDRSELMVILFQ